MTVLIIGGFDRSLVGFRGPFIRALVRRGHRVVACAPAENAEVPEQLSAMGAHFRPVRIRRTGLNPAADLRCLLDLRRLMRSEAPDAVLSYTIKPVIYGSLAARWTGVPRIHAMITGLGTAFSEGARWPVRFAATALYRLALRRCSSVFTHNSDINRFLSEAELARPEQLVSVRGSGIDVDVFSPWPVPPGPPSFLLLARLLRDKGIEEYVEAARVVRSRFPEARFRLAGAADSNPSSIPLERVRQWHAEGVIEYLPFQADVRPLLKACTAYVLPSYHEGLPRSVLEAMAVGRAVITTDTMGCRETVRVGRNGADAGGVIEGENGFLVPVRSSSGLASALGRFCSDHGLALVMGRRSRAIAVEEFDAENVNRVMIETMGL